MTFAVIALRNLLRHRRRTLLSMLVIAAGVIALVLTAGFVRFSFGGLREAIIRGGLGHLEIAGSAGPEGPDRAAPPAIAGWPELRADVEGLPHVRAAGAAVYVSGMASKGERSAAFVAVALEPDRERRMGFEVKLRGGRNLPEAPPAEGEDVVLLGVGLARSLGAGPGDSVTLTAMTAEGTLNAIDAGVAGLVTTGLSELDGRLLKMPLASGQRLLGTDRVSSVVVGLDDTARTEEMKGVLRARLSGRRPPVAILDWQERAPFYGQVRALYAGIFWFLGALVFVFVALANSNTMLMSVMERVREFGTLLAIGTSRAGVAAIVVVEALWLGLIGALVGDGLAWALVRLLNALRIKMPPPPGAVSAIDLRLAPVPVDFLGALALMMVVLLAAAVVPAVRSVRLKIVDALGHV